MSIDNINKSSTRSLSLQTDARAKKDFIDKSEAVNKNIKKIQENETEQLRSEHRQQILAEKERQADALNRLKTELDRSQRSLSEQKSFLLDSHQKNLTEHQIKQKDQLATNEKIFSDSLDTQKNKHKDVLSKANLNFNEEKNAKFLAQKDSLATIDQQTKNDLEKKTNQVNLRTQHENKVGEDLVKNLKMEKHRQFQNEDAEWKHKITQQNNSNKIEFHRQENLWKKTLKDEFDNHQKTYANTLEQQKTEFKNQENLFSRENERIKTEKSSQLEHIMNKTSDPFYQNSHIKPSIKDMGDNYQLSIPVADHEKDRYLLIGNDRTLTISFSRDFQQDIKLQDDISKTRRVESYNHSFQVADIVKPNTVSKNYANGTLTFNIKKA